MVLRVFISLNGIKALKGVELCVKCESVTELVLLTQNKVSWGHCCTHFWDPELDSVAMVPKSERVTYDTQQGMLAGCLIIC